MTSQDDLAELLLVPADDLEVILEPLVDAKILEPTEGRDREYLLARPPHRLTAGSVLAAYDTRSHRVFEPLGARLQSALDDLAAQISELREKGLDEVTLADLVAKSNGRDRADPG